MNILQVHKYYWPRDGATNYMLRLSDMLREQGHTVIPFSMRGKHNLPTPYSKFFVSEMDLAKPEAVGFADKIRYAGRMLYSFEAKKKMRRLLSVEDIDIAHVHNIYHHISPSIFGELKRKHIPIVMTLHDYKLICPNYSLFHHGAVHEEDCAGWYGTCVKNRCMKDSRVQSRIVRAEMIFHHKVMKFYEHAVDAFIAPSEFMMKLCVKYGWPKEKFVPIVHPVDTTTFSVSEKGGDYVAFVGRLSEEKGLDVLLDAAKQTADIPYVIIGDGPERKNIQARIKKERIHNIRLTGFESGERLRKLMDGARLFVVPSIWYENYPLSVLEPKAKAKVVIGTKIGGIPELLPADLLVEPGDATDLAKKIALWYGKSANERKKMGKTLRKEVVTVNDPEKHVRAIERLYDQTMTKMSFF
ncbi:MAG: hypothetical protein COU35_04050 [Candidatus Magasanikbacteria bacterium CG10_big_fil_rev_8_21_14_0_10_47_10]|uniref:Glycosyltransferase family 1 protein n=1 Tax=Candidatus Magasanikbacteria bacterium CG10_big_fil_rev_8_21_14_0_10_47_10 TaxID=1974652 RepID=A0A2H0TPZ0_9BACT|nr:MAG: hypothetical protein COU35_04050 [Candidatus Magasanikbacteria bacterium CG10_big_fil_rev_8_21_14_0_10_47_10]